MIRCRSAFLAVVLCGFTGVSSWAQSAAPVAPTASHPPSKPTYLTGTEKVWSTIPAKPALGSATDQADLKTTLALQVSRTEEQKKEALADKHYVITLMTDVIDPAFKAKYVHVYGVLDQADKDCYFITTMLKNENARPRPYEQHPDVVHPLFTTGGLSYPSGHASGMELQARLLGTLFQAKSQDLLKRAQQIGDSRVIAGVHYPSDVKVGLELGDLIFTELEANSKFKDALAAAAKADKVPAP